MEDKNKILNKRTMTEILKKVTKQDVRNTLAMTWVALSFWFLFTLLKREIPEGNRDVVNAIAGIIVGQLIGIVAYYFGQSKTEVDQTKREHNE